jgi:hypothetical protein
MTTKTDAPPTPSTELVAYDPQLFPALREQDPREAQARIAARFVKAETLDDLFNVLEGRASKDMVGRRLEVHGVSWAPYQSDEGTIPLAIVNAVDVDTGELVEFATTGRMLTMFIAKAELIDALPFKARITSVKTRQGRDALNFERV